MKKNLMLIFFLAICFLAAWMGGQATYPSIPTWYAQLQKPSFNPPNQIFGPVWTLLYAMMAVAAWLVWKKVGWVFSAFSFFFLQLAANTLWSILFFGMHRPDLALIDIAILWLLIGTTLFSFWKIDVKAAWLLVPYWLWVSFASVLNYFIWKLN